MNYLGMVAVAWVGALAYTVVGALLYRDMVDLGNSKSNRQPLFWSIIWPITMILAIIAVFVVFFVVMPFSWVVERVLKLGDHG